MSEANKLQVGGQHYKTGYEHWDLMIDLGYGPAYLIGQATKYVARWRKKNGIEDLKKGLHFVNKLLENKHLITFGGRFSIDAIQKFAVDNDLNRQEHDFIECMLLMQDEDDLLRARVIVVALMEQWDREHPVQANPVPLEDSNKHADRVGDYDPLGR